jgi:endonuclease/exonuclease/phosphatase family metal-dependent hydrolase
MPLRVLTWNLKHGRAVPPAGRYLLDEFAGALARWGWDVALLQEVPPWWPPALAARAAADQRTVLTSRNALLPARRALATRWPDLMKSNGGGANAILVRDERITEHCTYRLCTWPERRQLQAVRLASGLWVGNLHATAHNDPAARRDAERARTRILVWAAGAPLVLGGDFNLLSLSLPGFVQAAGHDVDLIFVAGLEPIGGVDVLARGSLSDHAPVRVTLAARDARFAAPRSGSASRP